MDILLIFRKIWKLLNDLQWVFLLNLLCTLDENCMHVVFFFPECDHQNFIIILFIRCFFVCVCVQALHINQCDNLRISGITSIDSPKNHISIHECKNVAISNINLIAPEESPNTDGIDISDSASVNIFDSTIQTGTYVYINYLWFYFFGVYAFFIFSRNIVLSYIIKYHKWYKNHLNFKSQEMIV